ncbi:DUF2188 domain-containing protein [Aliicoccus persicus]|uniref:Uncharacterized protein YdaT n=1 Tax=Aliicoccus persicus TaxID=930138 RepID=A0A662Z8H8_9STAP|nr:DUF2188 domain-containing protein [Aliicoccus persicus]SEW14768.1 Uncharacterized protein YdaT [Aliicoccus persicus]
MPWNMNDYPNSFKNFDQTLRKKMIDIANSMVDAGYDEDEAIPIATEQAKEWYDNASKSEVESFEREPNPSKKDSHDNDSARPELMDEDVEVKFDEDEKNWQVKTVTADRASDLYDTKDEALKRAKEIADNKGTNVISYTKEGKKES